MSNSPFLKLTLTNGGKAEVQRRLDVALENRAKLLARHQREREQADSDIGVIQVQLECDHAELGIVDQGWASRTAKCKKCGCLWSGVP